MKSRRSAYTLVELLAVLSVFSATLAIIILTLHGLQKSSDRLRSDLESGTEQGRFAHQLRSDAHAAETFVARAAENSADQPTTLELTLPDQQTIEYQLCDDHVQRLVRRGNAVVQRESYRVVPAAHRGWTAVTTGVRPLVTVYLQRPAASAPDAHPSAPLWCVDAVIGLSSSPNQRPAAESTP